MSKGIQALSKYQREKYGEQKSPSIEEIAKEIHEVYGYYHQGLCADRLAQAIHSLYSVEKCPACKEEYFPNCDSRKCDFHKCKVCNGTGKPPQKSQDKIRHFHKITLKGEIFMEDADEHNLKD